MSFHKMGMTHIPDIISTKKRKCDYSSTILISFLPYAIIILTVFVFLILQPCSKLNEVSLRNSNSWSGDSNRIPSPSPSTRSAPALVPAPITKSSLPMEELMSAAIWNLNFTWINSFAWYIPVDSFWELYVMNYWEVQRVLRKIFKEPAEMKGSSTKKTGWNVQGLTAKTKMPMTGPIVSETTFLQHELCWFAHLNMVCDEGSW